MNQHTTGYMPEASSDLPSIHGRAEFLIGQRNRALEQVKEAAENLQSAYGKVMEAVASIKVVTRGELSRYRYAHRDNKDYEKLFCSDFNADKACEAFRRAADTDIWHTLVSDLGVERWMDHKARKEFREQLAGEVPEVTLENLEATFETLFSNRRTMFLRGLANVFSKLDRRFRSHDVFKIGSRIIVSGITGYSGGFQLHTDGAELLNDVDRCLRALLGLPEAPGHLIQILDKAQGRTYGPKRIECDAGYVKAKVFLNGNAHIMLSDDAARCLNLALAEFYGQVMPDAADAATCSETFNAQASSVPSKELAFYATPDKAADYLLSDLHLSKGLSILEPSAGMGGIIRAIRRRVSMYQDAAREDMRIEEADLNVRAVEIHAARTEMLRRTDGDFCSVTCANFLQMPQYPVYDYVLMNPPFHGYKEHIEAAFGHIKPGGQLRAILPVTAQIGEGAKHARFHRWLDKVSASYSWRDLPPGSFEKSGTMVNTVVLKIRKPG